MCLWESCASRGCSPKRQGCAGEGGQLTGRGAGAGVAVAPVRGLVTLATLAGAELGPLLPAQAAGAPQGSARGLPGSPGGTCRDRTEMLLRDAGSGALGSTGTPSSCALLPQNPGDSSAAKAGARSWPAARECCRPWSDPERNPREKNPGGKGSDPQPAQPQPAGDTGS